MRIKIPAFIFPKKVPKGWTIQTVNLGKSNLLYLNPTKQQLKEIDPNCNLSITPHGKIPPKPVSTFIKILDKLGGPPPDPNKPQPKYFDFDINELATFKDPSQSPRGKKNKNKQPY